MISLYLNKGIEMSEYENKDYLIFRTESAGVFCGFLNRYEASVRHAWIHECRRIWSVEKAFTLSAVALNGIQKGKMSVVTPGPNCHILSQVVELIPCTEVAIKSLREFPAYEA